MEPSGSKQQDESGDFPYIKNGRRREYKEWFKAQVVEECHKPGCVKSPGGRSESETFAPVKWPTRRISRGKYGY